MIRPLNTEVDIGGFIKYNNLGFQLRSPRAPVEVAWVLPKYRRWDHYVLEEDYYITVRDSQRIQILCVRSYYKPRLDHGDTIFMTLDELLDILQNPEMRLIGLAVTRIMNRVLARWKSGMTLFFSGKYSSVLTSDSPSTLWAATNHYNLHNI